MQKSLAKSILPESGRLLKNGCCAFVDYWVRIMIKDVWVLQKQEVHLLL
jgi:hypothetical protein